MLRALAYVPQILLLALAGYNLLIALWGWRDLVPRSRGTRHHRFLVLIPAHDEADVIGAVLDDLAAQDLPAGQVEVVVVADRCRDTTANVADGRATVFERESGPPGKGEALAWALERRPLRDGEALVILDADNRVSPNLLSRFSDELDAGEDVLQAYLDVVEPEGSVLVTASALTYWAGNRMVQLARTNLGWSSDLGGTGMCISGRALARVGGFGRSVTEDQELVARLVLAGFRVRWLHDLRVMDEKPASIGVAMRQRARWMAGKRQVASHYVSPLLAAALRRRSLAPADLALRLRQPGRSFVALVSGAGTVLAAVTGSPLLLHWAVWGVATAIQVLSPLPFLRRDQVAPRYLVRFPLVTVIAAIWLPVRVVRSRVRGWYHTPHG